MFLDCKVGLTGITAYEPSTALAETLCASPCVAVEVGIDFWHFFFK